MAGGVRKTNLRVNLGIGGVDMPSMRAAVNDNIGFEMEEIDDDTAEKDKKEGRSEKEGRHFQIQEQKEHRRVGDARQINKGTNLRQ